jgi:hypothetical protein
MNLVKMKSQLLSRQMSRVLFLGSVLLIGCNSFSVLSRSFLNEQDDAPVVTESEIVPSEASLAESEAIVEHETGTNRAGDSIAASLDAQVEVASDPTLGEITFALDVTDTYEPVEPSILFSAGITEIHAVFDYSGISTDQVWERAWYLNDQEVSRHSDPWTGPENGTFDYFIDTGGDPLPTGDWILEIYVDGELRSLGVFIIEANSGETGAIPGADDINVE